MTGQTYGDGDLAVADEYRPTFYIGHHESKRTEVTPQLMQQAQDCNYDMLTVPITTPYFNLRVLNSTIDHLATLETEQDDPAGPFIPPLTDLDTNLTPGNTVTQILGIVAPWIDLCSPDPVIYSISCKVLQMEVSYAAFCGVGNLILPNPRLYYGKKQGEGLVRYAHAIHQALELGTFIQFSVTMPMMDNPHDIVDETNGSLALQARFEFTGNKESSDHVRQDERSSFESQPWELLDIRPRKKIPVSSKHDYFGTWDAWNIIRTICTYSHRLFLALLIPRYLPPATVCSRWFSEPLRILCLGNRTFYENKSGYPVLHKEHKALIHRYMRLRNAPWVVLCDVAPIPGTDHPEVLSQAAEGSFNTAAAADNVVFPTPAEASTMDFKSKRAIDPLHYLNLLRRLQQEQSPRTVLERFGSGYQDYLQAPLQPLTDNLESITYEVFEKDPVKYALYGEAIEKALIDWRQKAHPPSGSQGKIVVAVVGAGRGPLVTRALKASATTGVPIELWALEKNPNAFVLLERHNMTSWGNHVHLVRSDMRSWKGPSRVVGQNQRGYPSVPLSSSLGSTSLQYYFVDILISELLGSFADNELSPECLDGIFPSVNPTHGISIPRSYTSYLTPIAAPKLHGDILARTPTDKEAPCTPYVVMLQSTDYLSTIVSSPKPESLSTEMGAAVTMQQVPDILSAWSFHHSVKRLNPLAENEHNTRQAHLTFTVRDRGVCHGLAGYFEAVLFPGVELSIHPQTMEEKSPGMMSWFPIYFPLKEPMYLPDASNLTVSMFRKTDGRKVWYEWILESWMELPPFANGSSRGENERKKIRLNVSEATSSKERGCMM